MRLIERFLEVAHIRKKSRLSRGTRLLYIRIKRRKRRKGRMEKVLAKAPVPAIPSPSSDLPDTSDVS